MFACLCTLLYVFGSFFLVGYYYQGSVGSCWAFSAAENVEGQHFLKSKMLEVLAPEQLVDCDATQVCNRKSEKENCSMQIYSIMMYQTDESH